MKNGQEIIIDFDLNTPKVSVTHGYNISNAFPIHFHSTYNLGIIELGEREFSYRGIKTILKPNDIFIIQPFEPHSCKSVNKTGHSYKMLSLTIDRYCFFPDLVIPQPELSDTIKKFHSLAEYERTSEQLSGLYNEIIMQLKTYSTECGSGNPNGEVTSKIQFAKQFIENNCQRYISLREMSAVACLSEFHFNRFFHKCYGLSPYAYYLVCKMKRSQKVLLKQNSVLDTTYDIGSFDQSHFTKLFKKHVGVTPGRYLKDNKREIYR